MGKKGHTGWSSTQEGSASNSVGLSNFSSSTENRTSIHEQKTIEEDLPQSYHSSSRAASQEFGTPSPVPLSAIGNVNRLVAQRRKPPTPPLPDINLAISSEEQSARSEEVRHSKEDSTTFYTPTPSASKRGTPESAESKDFHLPKEFKDKHLEWVKKPKEEKKAWANSLQKPDTSLPPEFINRLNSWDAKKQEAQEQPFAPGLVKTLKELGERKSWEKSEEERESKQSKENGDKKKCCIVM